MAYPLLYSFRRCPYAMRARLGILYARQTVRLREIVLKHKPEAMLQASPKGTVPVMILASGEVIDESLPILKWALSLNDSADLLLTNSAEQRSLAKQLIWQNDNEFKPCLDRYKYFDRYPEHSQSDYRRQGEVFIAKLEALLTHNPQLVSCHISIADIAIFPFIRQFALVDLTWWQQAPYPNVRTWLDAHLSSEPFTQAMQKYPTWLSSGEEFIFGQSD
ncbi:glutathione S-transferase [Shewanella sp. AS1]|uniref:glutathione S-transferase n=1 Tax=Shewanella sp. AS1 TaxID=2907626 RepID=UPI001F1FF7BF|nr:glutathione S-transferase [Shewanella sp. AS1]MCE9678887.1 glutathione S-transferase [Shewanella sp. AS1]